MTEMASNLATLPEPGPLRAVTVCRDVLEFELLIEDMEAQLGEDWGDLTFPEATVFLRQDDAKALEFIVIAIDQEDEPTLPRVRDLITQAKGVGVKVILVADGLDPVALHELLRAGADDFAPYPLPQNALGEAVTRLNQIQPSSTDEIMSRAGGTGDATQAAAPSTGSGGRSGGEASVFAFQGAAGGTGATTIAVNLAWELSKSSKTNPPSVCVIDLGLQFGAVATYLDVECKPSVVDVLTDLTSMDEQGFRQSLVTFRDTVHVFTAPAEIVPYDLIGPEQVAAALALAKSCFDIVIVDMPSCVTGWTDTVMQQADLFFMCCELEMRCAQGALRFQRLLQMEGVPSERMTWLLNRAPGRMDMNGRGRVDKMAQSLGIKFRAVLPDGGKQILEANDQAMPVSELAARNAFAKEVQTFAADLLAAREEIDGGAAGAKKKSFLGLSLG